MMETAQSNPEAKPSVEKPSAWKAILIAGVTASLFFQLLEIILIPLTGGGSPWGPTRMIAAILLGKSVLPPPATFDLFVVAVAFAIDIVLAVVYAAVLGRIIKNMARGTALFLGTAFGAGLYVVNFYGFTHIFPWFEMGRNGVTLITHVIFSVTVVWIFQRLKKEGSTVVTPAA